MKDWKETDVGDFEPERSDQAKILQDRIWVPCRICRQIFNRIRLTARYCSTCGRGFCEGEHGNFAGGRTATCVRCYRGDGDIV